MVLARDANLRVLCVSSACPLAGVTVQIMAVCRGKRLRPAAERHTHRQGTNTNAEAALCERTQKVTCLGISAERALQDAGELGVTVWDVVCRACRELANHRSKREKGPVDVATLKSKKNPRASKGRHHCYTLRKRVGGTQDSRSVTIVYLLKALPCRLCVYNAFTASKVDESQDRDLAWKKKWGRETLLPGKKYCKNTASPPHEDCRHIP
jgi:hypothetical protein